MFLLNLIKQNFCFIKGKINIPKFSQDTILNDPYVEEYEEIEKIGEVIWGKKKCFLA